VRWPTLIVAGAQKCGTTTLARVLARHPQVFMSKPKELHYFDSNWNRGEEWYLDHFDEKLDVVHWGEASPSYMFRQVARERMRALVPDVRLVVILRDPTSRAYSHYWHNVRRGEEQLGTFVEALEAEEARTGPGSRPVAQRRFSYTARGRYLEQLQVLEKNHGRDNLHVMLLEDLRDRPVDSLVDLFGYLGVDTDQAERLQVKRANAYRQKQEDGSVVAAEYERIDPGVKAHLHERFAEDNDRLAAWLGRDLSHWNDPTH